MDKHGHGLIEFLKNNGFDAIYSDSDSVFIKSRPNHDLKADMEKVKVLIEYYIKEYKDRIYAKIE